MMMMMLRMTNKCRGSENTLLHVGGWERDIPALMTSIGKKRFSMIGGEREREIESVFPICNKAHCKKKRIWICG